VHCIHVTFYDVLLDLISFHFMKKYDVFIVCTFEADVLQSAILSVAEFFFDKLLFMLNDIYLILHFRDGHTMLFFQLSDSNILRPKHGQMPFFAGSNFSTCEQYMSHCQL